MSNGPKNQPSGAGNAGAGADNAIDSSTSGSAGGNEPLSESSLDTVTGGTGEVLNKNILDYDDDDDSNWRHR